MTCLEMQSRATYAPKKSKGIYPGESRLWEKNNFRVAIDIGRASELGARAAAFNPHVVIFTHSDADHVGLAERSSSSSAFRNGLKRLEVHEHACKCSTQCGGDQERVEKYQREFWLPLDWYILLHLAQNVSEDFEEDPALFEEKIRRLLDDTGTEIRNNIAEAEDELCDSKSSYRTVEDAAQIRGSLSRPITRAINRIKKIRLNDEDLALEIETFVSKNQNDPGKGKPDSVSKHSPTATAMDAIALSLKNASQRIRYILKTAEELDAKIRWFNHASFLEDHACYEKEGIEKFVTIINGYERFPLQQHKAIRVSASSLVLQYLTIQNRRALATFLWPSCDPCGNGAIIWSDTESAVCGQTPDKRVVPWEYVSFMSAPHHASTAKEHEDIWAEMFKISYGSPDKPALRPILVGLSNNSEKNCDAWKSLDLTQRRCQKCATKSGFCLMVSSHPLCSHPALKGTNRCFRWFNTLRFSLPDPCEHDQ